MAEQCQHTLEVRFFLGLAIAGFIISAITVVLRVYTRLYLAKPWGWDDTSIVIAYLVSVAACGTAWKNYQIGLGRPGECLLPSQALYLFELLIVSESLSLISMTFSRLSVIFFVLRVLGVKQTFRRLLYVWAVFMMIQQLTSALLPFAYCRPVGGAWDPVARTTGACWTQDQIRATVLFNGVTSSLSDLGLALLPAYFLIRLNLPLFKRVLLTYLMALGLIPAGCSVGRTILLHRTETAYDNYTTTTLFIFGGCEMYTLLFCASVPPLMPLYNKIKQPRENQAGHQQSIHAPVQEISPGLFESSSHTPSKTVRGDDGIGREIVIKIDSHES